MGSFTNMLSPSAMLALEKHDDALASICQEPACRDTLDTTATTESAMFSIASSMKSLGQMSSRTLSSTASTVCPVDRNSIRKVGYMGAGTYCRVDTVVPNGPISEDSSACSNQFAYKSIDPLRIECPHDFDTATAEMANEAKILSSLDHENIIKLRGVSSERFSQSFVSGNGYFLMMDILCETLKDRLDSSKANKKQAVRKQGILKRTQKAVSKKCLKRTRSSTSLNKSQECKDLHSRIQETVLGIAKGMKYLHSRNIVLRDMKPANIGYENNHYDDEMHGVESIVKLFDFGMAKNVDECNPEEIAGSPRYMAPEVMAAKGYSLAVDVYSFGVILYEMCSLKTPFEKSFRRHNRKHVPSTFFEAVAEEGLKPWADLEREVCCPMLRALIEACCDHDPAKRPSFGVILNRLCAILSSEDLEIMRAHDGSVGGQAVTIEFDLPLVSNVTLR